LCEEGKSSVLNHNIGVLIGNVGNDVSVLGSTFSERETSTY
jgi:hypothetical protein